MAKNKKKSDANIELSKSLFDVSHPKEWLDNEDWDEDEDDLDDDAFMFEEEYRGMNQRSLFGIIFVPIMTYYGVLRTADIADLLNYYFPYYEIDFSSLKEELLSVIGDTYNEELDVFVHPSLTLFMDQMGAIVERILEIREMMPIYYPPMQELFVLSMDSIWLPEYALKAFDLVHHKQFYVRDANAEDKQVVTTLWFEMQVASVFEAPMDEVIKGHCKGRVGKAFKAAFEDIYKHTRLWALSGRMLSE